MTNPIFLFVTGDVVSGMDFLVDEKLAFRYSARRKEIRIMVKKLSRLPALIMGFRKRGCTVTRRYEETY